MVEARPQRRRPGRPGAAVEWWCVIGDGALTGGMAYEALNHAGHLRHPLLVVLNDNTMSIEKNVGAMSTYLSRLRTDPTLYRFRRDLDAAAEAARGRRPHGRHGRAGQGQHQGGHSYQACCSKSWLHLRGRDRRPRHRGAAGQYPALAGGRRPGTAALPDGQGQGLCSGRAAARPLSRHAALLGRRPASASTRKGPPPSPEPSARRWSSWPRGRARGRYHSGHGGGHRPGPAQGGHARPVLRRGHSRGARRGVRGRAGGGGQAAGRGHLFDLPAAGLRPDDPRRVPAGTAGGVRGRPGGSGGRGRAHSSRRFRSLLPANRPWPDRVRAQGRGGAAAYAGDGAQTGRTLGHPLSAFGRGGRAPRAAHQAARTAPGWTWSRGRRRASADGRPGRRLAEGPPRLLAARGHRGHGGGGADACTRWTPRRSGRWSRRIAAVVTVEDNALAGGFGSAILEFMADAGYVPAGGACRVCPTPSSARVR